MELLPHWYATWFQCMCILVSKENLYVMPTFSLNIRCNISVTAIEYTIFRLWGRIHLYWCGSLVWNNRWWQVFVSPWSNTYCCAFSSKRIVRLPVVLMYFLDELNVMHGFSQQTIKILYRHCVVHIDRMWSVWLHAYTMVIAVSIRAWYIQDWLQQGGGISFLSWCNLGGWSALHGLFWGWI